MYMTSQRMKVYFVDFFFHPKFVVIYDYCECELSNMIIKILVANVACNLKLVVGTSCKMAIFY
jgi:hypothetical protein